ncbi:ATP-binding cassette domain-containing protein [Shewanella loihica]|uniref:ABC transporter-related protein n=1 Tax=Shewanella loihica (strain ATCC BAA-1088 / PV-4) TaxID=323850 RepID=A3QFX0_SHELP|nr:MULTISPECIES: ATP-binding cassette domain-containing protein [Shewanella]ABO24368.1 ABC transporter-related protein [Shewanella loihica PV-4]KIO37387.1 peptide ABC transporter ATP-binding protein [Shewanella sp. cp20]MCG9722030.1 ATP-binding cassette domain-containing protein [Shewanella sp. Isolate7]MCG9747014.1 ATP-binding cassette domain-containing protein [Shewanella sp. Isolate8]MCL2908563.1 ATP-binding cassette domain-containing protein [Shewanella aquimarina]
MKSPLLKVNRLSKTFFAGYKGFKRQYNHALEPISFELNRGETLAIVGETGSGKSTLARILVGAEQRTDGEILFEGEALESRNLKQRCRLIRMIFQDPNTSLNPRLTVGELLDEPLRFNTDLDKQARFAQVVDTLRKVGLLPEHADFYPHMISEGMKQRVAVARALMLNPKIIIADEALTALDLSVRSQILNLLLKLQQEMGLSYIFVSHNMNIIRHFSDKIMVLHQGKMVEKATTEKLFNAPEHEYTQRLIQEQTMFSYKR